MHGVWALIHGALTAGLVLMLAWLPGALRRERLLIASIVSTLGFASFVTAVILAPHYGGSFAYGGAPQLSPTFNVLAFCLGLPASLSVLVVCWRGMPDRSRG